MSETETVLQKKNKKTKKYDEVVAKIRKLLTATAATYIPELCEALREDWFPDMTDITFKKNKAIQDEIREKVLDEWSNDRGNESPWGDVRIQMFFPDWLRNPVAQEGTKEAIKLANAARSYQAKINRQRLEFDQVATSLPEPPKEPESHSYTIDDEEAEDAELEDIPMLSSHGEPEEEKDTMDYYTEINEGVLSLWKALTREDTMPHAHEDLTLDHIKPTRKFRTGIIHKLDIAARNGLKREANYLISLLQDTIEIIDGAEKK